GRAGDRRGQHAGQAAVLHQPRRKRRAGAGRACAGDPELAFGQRHVAAGILRGGGAASRAAERGETMTTPVILTLNAGSSSLKFALYEAQTEALLARGQVDRIGPTATLAMTDADGA